MNKNFTKLSNQISDLVSKHNGQTVQNNDQFRNDNKKNTQRRYNNSRKNNNNQNIRNKNQE